MIIGLYCIDGSLFSHIHNNDTCFAAKGLRLLFFYHDRFLTVYPMQLIRIFLTYDRIILFEHIYWV